MCGGPRRRTWPGVIAGHVGTRVHPATLAHEPCLRPQHVCSWRGGFPVRVLGSPRASLLPPGHLTAGTRSPASGRLLRAGLLAQGAFHEGGNERQALVTRLSGVCTRWSVLVFHGWCDLALQDLWWWSSLLLKESRPGLDGVVEASVLPSMMMRKAPESSRPPARVGQGLRAWPPCHLHTRCSSRARLGEPAACHPMTFL